jgi:hypothetical protein
MSALRCAVREYLHAEGVFFAPREYRYRACAVDFNPSSIGRAIKI